MKPYWKMWALSLVVMIVASLATLAQPWPLATMLDIVSGHRTGAAFFFFGARRVFTILIIASVIGFGVIVISHGLTVINSYLDSKLEQSIILDLRSDLFRHAQRLSLSFHDERRTGELMSRINYAAASLGAIIMAVPPLLQSLLTLVGMAIIAFLIDWKITLISLSVLPFMYYAMTLYGVRIVPRLERVQSLEWQSLSIVNEAMGMLRVIVPFGREAHEFQRFRRQGETAVGARVGLTVRQTLFNLAVTACTAVGTGLVFYFGFRAHFTGRLSVGNLIVLLAYVAAVYGPLERISNTVGSLHQQFVSLKASFDLLDLAPEVQEDPDAISVERVRGAVEFDDVTFSYKGRSPVLRNVSLEVPAGSRVAVVGATGAGKTTLISLLVRFYDPQHGRILIDGLDVRRFTLASLRAQISLVTQEPLLFSGSIAENIRYGRLDAAMDEVVAAARAANADAFITRLPHGYESLLGERGAGLSGGERQRIAVARAFLKDAPILLLDEPTSSIDSKTEDVILDALDRLVVGRTSFMIAHRLSTIRQADLIVVLDHGRIAETGTHEELMARDTLYRQLHEVQTRGRARHGGGLAPANGQSLRQPDGLAGRHR